MNLQWLKAASIARAYCWVALPLVVLIVLRAWAPEVYEVVVSALVGWLGVGEVLSP